MNEKQGRAALAVALAGSVALTLGAAAGPDPMSPGVGPRAIQDLQLEIIVNAKLGLVQSELFELDDLAAGMPLEVDIPIHGEVFNLDLDPYSVRAAGYKVYLSDGVSLTEREPGPVNTMRGAVSGDPGSFVAASVVDGDLYGRVELSDGNTYWFEPVADHVGREGLHVVYHADDVLPTGGLCGTEGFAREVDDLAGSRAPGEPQPLGTECAELAIDADFFYQQRWGGNTESRVNTVINQMNVQYERDVDISHQIVAIIVRTTQVYNTNNPQSLLNAVTSRWQNVAPERNIVRDVVQLFTARNLDGNVIGIAWLSAVCVRSRQYSVVESDFNNNFACATDLSAHELGHNWASDHCSCSSYTMNSFITCANRFHPTFSIPEIISFRNSRNCLGVCEGSDPGRCCFPDGSCQELTENDCNAQGGDAGPPNSQCDGSCPPAVPENDECLDAIAISEGTFEYDSTSATTDGPQLPAQCDEGFGLSFVQDIWYFYTPTCDGTATVSLCNSGYDTRLAVYIQSGPCPGIFQACNDDACGAQGLRSEVSFPVNQNLLYVIRVGGFDDGGAGEMVVSCEPDQEGQPALPESFDVTRGNFVSGDLADLFSSDNDYVTINAVRSSKIGASSVEIEVATTSPFSNASKITLTVEAAATGFPANRVTQMFNYDSNSWETVDQRAASTNDTVVDVMITTNPGRFVSNSDEMMARVGYLDLGVTFVSWNGRFDRISWFVEP